MSCYIASTNERLYVSLEQSFGAVSAVTEKDRIPAVKLESRQKSDLTKRRDKTGSRTFAGLPSGIRRNTDFKLDTFLTSWNDRTRQPSHGPLFQAAMGGTPKVFAGGVVQSAIGVQLSFTGAHGLTPGQAVTHDGEMRFVVAIGSSQTVILNAPFTGAQAGASVGGTITYVLATDLPTASIFDYWDPVTAVQRVISGAAMDKLRIRVNGDFHEFQFSGPARDLIDSASFTSGEGGLTQFPAEPAQAGFDYTIVPGHIGQAWIGTGPTRFYSLTSADVELSNNIALRNREFGSDLARCLSAGERQVAINFSLFEQDDAATRELYQAARQRSPIPIMFQLGQQDGQLFGIQMNGVIPEVPEFADSETRLEWRLTGSRAQGGVNDELYIAFG